MDNGNNDALQPARPVRATMLPPPARLRSGSWKLTALTAVAPESVQHRCERATVKPARRAR